MLCQGLIGQDLLQDENADVTIAAKYHGKITKEELLQDDELHLNKSQSQKFHIISFHMSLGSSPEKLCFFENRENNKLTSEMLEAIRNINGSFILVFSGITCASSQGSILRIKHILEFKGYASSVK